MSNRTVEGCPECDAQGSFNNLTGEPDLQGENQCDFCFGSGRVAVVHHEAQVKKIEHHGLDPTPAQVWVMFWNTLAGDPQISNSARATVWADEGTRQYVARFGGAFEPPEKEVS